MTGPITNTKTPRIKTSSTMRYMILKIPNVSHQRRGDVSRQVLTEVYSRIWAVRNQLKVKREERSVNLQ